MGPLAIIEWKLMENPEFQALLYIPGANIPGANPNAFMWNGSDDDVEEMPAEQVEQEMDNDVDGVGLNTGTQQSLGNLDDIEYGDAPTLDLLNLSKAELSAITPWETDRFAILESIDPRYRGDKQDMSFRD